MKNKLLILTIIILLLNISIINAVDNKAVAYYEPVSDAEKTVKILFHSWGEGLTTTIDLDNYFPVKRDANTQYLYISPPEIIVSIDQATGIATLKESKDWIGTKEVYFSISDIYHLYEGQTSLQKYVEKIKKERESETIKTQIREFEDSSVYPYLNSLLDKLEKEKGSSETPEIKATFKKPHLEIGVGDSINFDIGVQTKTKEGIKTYRPYLILNIKPEKQIAELEEGEGFSIWILAPLFIILLVLAIILYFYIKDNLPSIKRFINKIIPTKKKTTVDILTQDVKNLKSLSLELKKLFNQLNKLPENNLSEQYFNIAKKFFNSLTHPNYEFTYAEITKEILEEDLSDDLKNQLLDFSKELSDLRFSGERITKPEISDLIERTQSFIDKAIQNKQKSKIKESTKLIQKAPLIKYFNLIKSFFKKEERVKELQKKKELEIQKSREKERRRKERREKIRRFLHSLRLFKTEAEKLRELQRKRELEIQKSREKERRRKERREKIRRFLHSLRLFKTEAEKLRELQRKRELEIQKLREKERKKEARRRERVKFVKTLLHSFGLYKTEAEKIKKEKEKQRLELEEKSIQDLKEKEHERIRKERIKTIKNFLHSLRLFKTEAEKLKELQKKKELEIKKKREEERRELEKERKIKEKKELELKKRREEERRELEKKELAIKKRKERRERVRRFFHNLGFYKTEAEKLRELQRREELKLEEEKKKREKIRLIKNFLHDKFGFFRTKSEKEKEDIKKERLELKKKELTLEKEKEKKKTEREIKKSVKKFLHDTFGLFKTEEERRKEKIEKEKLKLKRKEEEEKQIEERKKKLQKRKELEIQKLREKDRRKKERRERIRRFFHKLGFYKTEAEKLKELQKKKELEIKKKREEEKRKLEKERKIKEKKELELKKRREEERRELEKKELAIKRKKERKEKVKKFFHDNLGLFKTEAEKLKEKEEKKRELQRKRELILKKKREEEKKRIEKLNELKIREKLKLEKQKERKEKVKKFFHDNLGLFKTEAEKLKEKEEKKRERIEKRIKKIEIKKKIKKNISEKINSFFRFIIKKRKLTAAEELQLLMKQEREALSSKDTKKAHEIDKKINILYKEIQKKPSLISKELHQAYQKLKNEFNLVKQKISETKAIELKPKITFLDKFKRIFSQEIEKTKIDEIKFLIKKIENQFELKAPDAQKISEYFLRANALYQKLNKISKNIISQELFKIKNKMGIIAIRSALEKAEIALKENQLKKAEEIYNKLTKTYYELPSKEREKLHEKRAILQEKLKPSQHLIQKQQEKSKKLFQFSLFKIKKPLFKPSIQPDIKKIKERVTKTFEEKEPFKKEFEVKEKLSDYLTAKKPSFPSIQTFLVKKETENKQLTQILKLISNINNYLSKKQHEKAKEIYLEAIKLFKELPEDIKPEIRDNIYHKLLPVKAQILDLSLHISLQKAKEAVISGKIKDAKEHHEIASKIYTHLATNTDVFIPGPITLKEKQLDDLIKNANELIKNNKIKELKEIYTKIIELYNELPPLKKQAYYNKISVIYNELLKK